MNDIAKYKDDRTGFVARIPKWVAKIRDGNHRSVAIYSGRGTGKSLAIALYLIDLAYRTPLRIACFREIQRSIADSSKQVLDDWARHSKTAWGVSGFWNTRGNTIVGKNGSTFIFKGLSSSTGTDRSIQSLQGIDLAWIEEAQNISEQSWQLLNPTIRKPGSRLIFSFNPRYPTDPIYKHLVEHADKDPNLLAIRLSWKDNTHWTPELEIERQRCLEVSPEAYAHIWEGAFRSDEENVLVHYDQIMECYENPKLHNGKRPSGFYDLGLDLATSAEGDSNAVCQRQGYFVHALEQWPGGKFRETSGRVKGVNNPPARALYFDAGTAGFGDDLLYDDDFQTELKPIHFGGAVKGKGVRIRPKVTNESFFAKRKDQLYWTLRLRVKHTLDYLEGKHENIKKCLVLSPNIPREIVQVLASQASGATYGWNTSGKVTVTKAQKGMPSPDLLDSLALAYGFDSDYGLRPDVLRGELPEAIPITI